MYNNGANERGKMKLRKRMLNGKESKMPRITDCQLIDVRTLRRGK